MPDLWKGRVGGALLVVLSLGLYLWPALRAPVVLWSDSQTDLDWARRGLGIFSPVSTPDHAAKPGYLLFLRAALAVSGGSPRGVLVVQSLLLWAGITLAAILLARRAGVRLGLLFWVVALLFLRLRDASSAVMSEALAAAIFLPVAAGMLQPPRRPRSLALLGLAEGALFLVRPNLGAAAILLSAVSFLLAGRVRALLAATALAAVVVTPFWIATSPPPSEDPTRGLTFQMWEASADDYWRPSLGPPPTAAAPAERSSRLREASRTNWKRTLGRSGPDTRRQLVWRALHGLLGTEFYDARWSAAYRRIDTASKILTPFAILAAIALLLAVPPRRENLPVKTIGLLLIGGILAQNLVLGSNPRYVLPMLPALFLWSIATLPGIARGGRPAILTAAALMILLVASVSRAASALAWEWGLVESQGVVIEQKIPRGSLPSKAPATLHVRIAPTLLPTGAGTELLDSDSRVLYSSASDPARERPEITAALPADLLERNRSAAVGIRLRSAGFYDPFHFLLFPVIPPPWRPPARRAGSSELSPASGVASGSLDWWAHAGTDLAEPR